MFFSFYSINKDSTIGIISLDKTSDEFLVQLTCMDWYVQKIKLMRENRKQEWLSIRVLLKKLLGEEKKISYTKKGKPYFSDNKYQIGISHTKGYAAVIINKNKSVSIDIQSITTCIKKAQTRFINQFEEKNLSRKNLLIHLLLHWCGKEVFYKILDQKNVDFRTQLHVCPFEPNMKGLDSFTIYETKTKRCQSFTIQYRVIDDYIVCWTEMD